MTGSVCPIEQILSRQPNLKVLRDPPTLAGQRVRCVAAFLYDSGQAGAIMCKVRAQAWTDPSLDSRWSSLDKEMSGFFAESVFEVIKAQFEEGNPDQIRSGEVNPWQYLF